MIVQQEVHASCPNKRGKSSHHWWPTNPRSELDRTRCKTEENLDPNQPPSRNETSQLALHLGRGT